MGEPRYLRAERRLVLLPRNQAAQDTVCRPPFVARGAVTTRRPAGVRRESCSVWAPHRTRPPAASVRDERCDRPGPTRDRVLHRDQSPLAMAADPGDLRDVRPVLRRRRERVARGGVSAPCPASRRRRCGAGRRRTGARMSPQSGSSLTARLVQHFLVGRRGEPAGPRAAFSLPGAASLEPPVRQARTSRSRRWAIVTTPSKTARRSPTSALSPTRPTAAGAITEQDGAPVAPRCGPSRVVAADVKGRVQVVGQADAVPRSWRGWRCRGSMDVAPTLHRSSIHCGGATGCCRIHTPRD